MAAHIWIVSPALADANNGNWQTARRWAHFLRTRYRVTLANQWPGSSPQSRLAASPDSAPDLLIALHARRSSAALANFTDAYPERPTLLLLTGTDLYRDIHTDATAQVALRSAEALVLLQPAGLSELPLDLHARTSVIYQSAKTLQAAKLPQRFFDVCMVGHLRAEKDPTTFMRASALVNASRVRMIHIGGALEPKLGALAQATEAATPRYRWLGPMAHAATRQRLKRCHLMAITSSMEGGANVIIEAVTSGVAVVASNISGNRGMLGDDYAGYFAPGDAAALAQLITRCASDTRFHALLQHQCALRAALFTPEAEQTALLQLVDNLIRN
ncbi:MAG: putative glycosyltransferase (TIGR04348 family) [Janthinobacterium sp.]|jgi:putative glycosyltransferase (TIGR04348 family)